MKKGMKLVCMVLTLAMLLGLLAVSWVYACAGLKRKEIPQDLDVDYIGGDQKKKEPEK